MEKENKIIVSIVLIIFIIIFSFYYLSGKKSVENIDNLNQDTNLNDNTIVIKDETLSWNILNDSKTGFEAKYPNDFFDEGHQLRISVGECNNEGFPIICPNIDMIINDLPENTSTGNVVINKVNYCLESYKDAAMGHTYNYNYYTTIINNKCAVIQIETNQTNCDLYLPLEDGNTEQKTNYDKCIIKNENQPKILDKIISTFKFIK